VQKYGDKTNIRWFRYNFVIGHFFIFITTKAVNGRSECSVNTDYVKVSRKSDVFCVLQENLIFFFLSFLAKFDVFCKKTFENL